MTQDASILFSPFRLGDIDLKNRVVMAPLTRSRATHDTESPNELNAEYYRQRASAGLIITEATQISQQGRGYIWTPGIYTPAQVEGWKKVTDAVHAEGGKIFLQLWHVGRASHVSFQPNGAAPVAPSAIRADIKTFTVNGFEDASAPRALSVEEIKSTIRDHGTAAANARQAGFDGVEIHAANGYLIEQFLKDKTNRRTDEYGGSVENRIRFVLEVADAVLSVWPRERVGIRISPVSSYNDISDSDPAKVYFSLIEELNARGLAYIHLIEGTIGGSRAEPPFDYISLRKAFSGAYIANNGYTREIAVEALDAHRADLIAFGLPFLANPDLVERLRRNAPLNKPDKDTFYGGDARGYTDYPTLT